MNFENINLKKTIYLVIILLITFNIANCGGGSSGSSSNDNNAGSINAKSVKWENGEVFYAIDETNFTENDIWVIQSAMNHISDKTDNAVIFLQVPYEDYLNNSDGILEIAKTNKNHASIGYCNDAYLYLSTEDFGIVLHELFHVLGFKHEFQRNDRDDYIVINEDNVIDSEKDNFKKTSMVYDETVFSYDYKSISLYGYSSYTFSKKSGELKTVEYKEAYPFYQVAKLSKMDIEKIKAVYSN